MDLRQLRLFLAVADEGHFTRAAARVNLSQPALTQQIARLEDELGVPLLERTSRGARLTPAGESLAADARRLLADAEASVRRARHAGGLTDARLRTGFDLVEFGSVPPLPSLLAAFRERFPEGEVAIQTLPGDELERGLLDGRLDLAFLLGPPGRPGVGFHPLLRGTFELLLPAAHGLADREAVPVEALRSLRVILPRLNPRDDEGLLDFLRAGDGGPRVSRTDFGSLPGLVAAGEGVAAVPSGLLRGGLGSGLLLRPFTEAAPSWSFGLAWNGERPTPLAALGQRLIRQMVPGAVAV